MTEIQNLKKGLVSISFLEIGANYNSIITNILPLFDTDVIDFIDIGPVVKN